MKGFRNMSPGLSIEAFLVMYFLLGASSVTAFTNLPHRNNEAGAARFISSTTALNKVPMERGDPNAEPAPIEEVEVEEDVFDDVIETSSSSMNELLRPPPSCNIKQMGPTAMAYIGDIVYELFIRSKFVWPPRKTQDLQQKVVGCVRAEYQSELLNKLVNSLIFTKAEEQILIRGRNSKTRSHNRRNLAAYQDSTSLETLLGYLYISDIDRCETIFNWIDAYVTQDDINGDDDLITSVPSTSMDELLRPPEMARANQMGPTEFAFIGDVLYELLIRSQHVWPTRKTSDMQLQVVALVRAEFQAALLSELTKSFPLSSAEIQVINRGRNSFKPTSQNQRGAISDFQDANALEALLGYLHTSDQNRCEDLVNWISSNLDQIKAKVDLKAN